MNLQNLTPLMIVVIVLALVIIGVLLTFVNKNNNEPEYKLRELLTENEKLCFNHLIRIYPEYYIFPQVSMGAMLEPTVEKGIKNKEGKSAYHSSRGKIQSNMIDFVISDKNLKPVFIIELDDNSHNNKLEQDAYRDSHFSKIGIPTLRFRNKSGKFPSREQLDQDLNRKKIVTT